MGLIRKFENWMYFQLKNEMYEVRDNEIVCGGELRPDRHFKADDVASWQIQTQMDRTNVMIELVDGSIFNWFDDKGRLVKILRRVAPARELPLLSINLKPAEPEIRRWD